MPARARGRWAALVLLAVAACVGGCDPPAAPSSPTVTAAIRIPTARGSATGAELPAPAETASRDAPAPTAEPSESASGEPRATASTPVRAAAECAPVATPAGFAECSWVELTGAPPCEAVCVRPRAAAPTKCCERPVEVVAFVGTREVLRRAACSFVPPDCAHSHGHGNMDAEPRFAQAAGQQALDLVIVEGGCEMRAILHGYVPPGVAAWTGCEHERYRWDGRALVRLAP
ncbi:MAG: hypothetical protein HY908_27615 [Myxococcales bacterium]|nr:hypothetical protein [Myxococcales bacterium]